LVIIFPPLAKACEPPAGIARLAGALRHQGFPCHLVDANLEAQLFLLASSPRQTDPWGRRATRNLDLNLAALRSCKLYANADRYRRAVVDVNQVLVRAGRPHRLTLTLANYQDEGLSPLRSADLLRSAAHPAANIFFPWFAARLSGLVEETNPPLVGFSLNYLSQAATTFAMIGFLKERYPCLPVVLGGGLVTSWLRAPSWRNPFAGLVDHLVAGPGEQALLDLLGGACQTGFETPSFQDLPLKDYLAPGLILPYAASSGCYRPNCHFCPEKAEGNPYLQIPPSRVLADIAGLRASTGPVMLHLLDNAVSPALLRALSDQPPGLDWYGFARVSHHLTDPDFCRALRQSGCRLLKLGIESGDQGVLDANDKGIKLSQVSKALHALAKAGIGTYVYLLFGTPAESEREARSTLDFVVRHAPAITYLNLAIFNMPIGSPEAASLSCRQFYEGDLALYTDFIHPHGWSRRAVRGFLEQEFTRRPEIASILRRDPLFFTSNHAPFFC
jgi:hypothetical protein